MSIDLIDRVHYLKKRGDDKHLKKVWKWISKHEEESGNEFINDSEKFYWKIISSEQFTEIIDEDFTYWFLVFSKNRTFRALAKVHIEKENLIDKIEKLGIRTIWILKSEFNKLEVNEKPILIWTPYFFERPLENINHDFNQLISKLKNPKVKLTEFIIDPKSKTDRRRIR